MTDAGNDRTEQEQTVRIELTAKMIPTMVETIEKFAAMGASPEHIVRFLQASIDEISKGRTG